MGAYAEMCVDASFYWPGGDDVVDLLYKLGVFAQGWDNGSTTTAERQCNRSAEAAAQ